jgi:hypothetical protein
MIRQDLPEPCSAPRIIASVCFALTASKPDPIQFAARRTSPPLIMNTSPLIHRACGPHR